MTRLGDSSAMRRLAAFALLAVVSVSMVAAEDAAMISTRSLCRCAESAEDVSSQTTSEGDITVLPRDAYPCQAQRAAQGLRSLTEARAHIFPCPSPLEEERRQLNVFGDGVERVSPFLDKTPSAAPSSVPTSSLVPSASPTLPPTRVFSDPERAYQPKKDLYIPPSFSPRPTPSPTISVPTATPSASPSAVPSPLPTPVPTSSVVAITRGPVTPLRGTSLPSAGPSSSPPTPMASATPSNSFTEVPTASIVQSDGDDTTAPPTAVSGDGDETTAPPTPLAGDGDETSLAPTPLAGDGDETSLAPTPALPDATTPPTEAPLANIIVQTAAPTTAPTDLPSLVPASPSPTKAPASASPTKAPVSAPPTATPTVVPVTASPTAVPATATPTVVPATDVPSPGPSPSPTLVPVPETAAPIMIVAPVPVTPSPTKSPTTSPTLSPTKSPTMSPSRSPVTTRTLAPTSTRTTLAPTTTFSPTSSEVPTTSPAPTASSNPTFAAVEWLPDTVIAGVSDGEVFGSSVRLSDDGEIVTAGAFLYSETLPDAGRLARIDLTDGDAFTEAYGSSEEDFVGFDLGASADGNRIVFFQSTAGTFEAVTYSAENGFEFLTTLDAPLNPSSLDFALSADGNWLAVGGEDWNEETGVTTILLFVYEFQEASGEFVQYEDPARFGFNEGEEWSMFDVAITADGRYVAISEMGEGEFTGELQVYERTSDGLVQLGDEFTSDNLEDGFGRDVELIVDSNGVLLLAFSIPNLNAVLVYVYDDDEGWVMDGSPLVFSEDGAEFGYDLAFDNFGFRLVVGIRCFDSCRGAVQTYQYDAGDWYPLGDLLEGTNPASYFGEAVDFDANGSVLAVGAPDDCADDICAGSVYVFYDPESFLS